MDILIVFGSVTSKQYEIVRLKMYELGQKPKVIRVNMTNDDLYHEHAISNTDTPIDQRANEYLKKVLEDAPISDIKAYIMNEAEPGCEDRWGLLTHLIESEAPGAIEYNVFAGKDGSFWVEDMSTPSRDY